MTIKIQPHPSIPYVQQVYEERYLSCNVDGWDTFITWGQHQTWVNDELESAMHVVLDILISKGQERYQGSLSLADDKCRYNYFYKLNAQRRREIPFDEVKPIIDKVIEYYRSPEGQSALISQTIKRAEYELGEMKSRYDFLENWVSRLKAN